jgi:hypothetical protein
MVYQPLGQVEERYIGHVMDRKDLLKHLKQHFQNPQNQNR